MADGSAHGKETTGVILRAFTANIGIAVAKFVAAFITGSSAMLTEGVHSLVDSVNQLLLWHGGRRAAKPADDLHPLGYGRELYFWSFVVAMLVFALGAGISLYEGVTHIAHPEPTTSPLVAFGVLAVAFALESWSLKAALAQFNAARGDKGVIEAIRDTKDTTTLIVLLEDSAAVAGLVIAAAGIGLELATGNAAWDGVASVMIGLVLAGVSVTLLNEAKDLLIGESADPRLVEQLRRVALEREGIERIDEVLTIHLSPDEVVCTISADFRDSLSAGRVEQITREIENAIAAQFPQVTRVYLRPFGEVAGPPGPLPEPSL